MAAGPRGPKNNTMRNVLVLLLMGVTLGSFAQDRSAAARKLSDTTARGLPVTKSFVRPEVIERAKKEYGSQLYSIEKSQGPHCLDSYLVGLILNGTLSLQFMCADPKVAFVDISHKMILAIK